MTKLPDITPLYAVHTALRAKYGSNASTYLRTHLGEKVLARRNSRDYWITPELPGYVRMSWYTDGGTVSRVYTLGSCIMAIVRPQCALKLGEPVH